MGAASRYRFLAATYDQLSGERLVYRAGRVEAHAQLEAREGDTVLDLGCGTGLNFPMLAERVGPRGHLVGVDASPQMLRMARRRADRLDVPCTLLAADATDAAAVAWWRIADLAPRRVIATYTLSLMDPWEAAWEQVVDTAPGARVAVADMARPTGRAAALLPAALLATWLGGADIDAHPWRAVERDCSAVVRASLRGGHLRVVSGVLP